MAYTEKCCSVCGVVNWDTMQGNYKNEHELADRKGRGSGEFRKCDTNGEVRKYDGHGRRMWE
jgi:hypothetical protein